MKRKVRVQKLLSNYGYCSRRKAEELIKKGKVVVKGEIISLGAKATYGEKIYVEGKPILPSKKLYLMFNKPRGCVTAVKDKKFKTVMDYIKIKERVFPVGRLDFNTSGLLLLTNDGDFANKVMHPRNKVTKTYLVETGQAVNKKEIALIEKGIEIDGEKVTSLRVKKHRSNLVELTICEGRKHIVRKIFSKLGIKVKTLKRIKIGNLSLGNLKVGKYRYLKRKEVESIFNGRDKKERDD